MADTQRVVAVGPDPVEVLPVPVGPPVDGVHLAQQPVQQGSPMKVPTWSLIHTGGVRHRGGEVHCRDRLVDYQPRRNLATPIREHRDLDPALPHGLLGTTQWNVLRAHVRTALVHTTGRDLAGMVHADVVLILIVM